MCWAEHGIIFSTKYWSYFHECEKKNDPPLFALDACPRYYAEHHARTIASIHPNARFPMLLRDPADRIVSHLNDNMIRFGGSSDIEVRVSQIIKMKYGMEWELSQYHLILARYLKYFDAEQILLIPTELLTLDTQKTIDAVMSHIGGTAIKVNSIRGNNNQKSKRYLRLHLDLLNALKLELMPVKLGMLSHTHYNFSW